MGTVMVKSTHPESQGEFVVIEESDFDPATHTRFVPPPPAGVAVPPPPPVAAGKKLPAKWRDLPTGDLMTMAANMNDGRTPENREQAIQMIESASK